MVAIVLVAQTVLMMHILDKDGLLKAHGIKRERMLAFMGAVESIYHSESNAYHNSMHATDVLQVSVCES